MQEMIDSAIVKTSFSSVCSETKTNGIMIKFFVSQNQQSGLFKFNKNKNGYIKTFTDAANGNKFFRLLHPYNYQHSLLILNYEIGSFKVSTEVWLIKQLVIIDFYRLN